MELGSIQSDGARGLTMAAPSYVFTVGRVARLLGEDEDLPSDIAMTMDPEDGRIYVMDADDETTLAFTEFGVENLRELLPDLKR